MSIKYWYNKNKYKILVVVCIIAAVASRYMVPEYHSSPASTKPSSFLAATNEQRISFLKNNSLDCCEESVEIVDVLIPTSFSGVFKEYQELQLKQGLSLENYKGMVLRKFTYKLKDEMSVAELLVYDDKIVACAVCNLSTNGVFDVIIK